MGDDESPYRWDDEARVIVHPPEPAVPHFHADLAACVRRAIQIADGQPTPDSVEIEHGSGFIGMDEVRAMAADPGFPVDPEADRLQPMSRKP